MKILTKHFLFFIGLFAIIGSNYAQNSEGDYFFTDDFIMDWSHFEGEADTTSQYAAEGSMGLGYDKFYNDTVFILRLAALFNPAESWVRYKTEEGLVHEYYHFKIAEIAKRRMMKELFEFDLVKYPLDMDWWIEDRFRAYAQYNFSQQEVYDEESDHSHIKTIQQNWQREIDEELSDLKEFKPRYIVFYFDENKKLAKREMTNRLPIRLNLLFERRND